MVLEPLTNGIWTGSLGKVSAGRTHLQPQRTQQGQRAAGTGPRPGAALLWSERKVPLPGPEHLRLSAVVPGALLGEDP